MRRVVIVDAKAEHYQLQPENALPIKPFTVDARHDNQLSDIKRVLRDLASRGVEDVRVALRQLGGDERIPKRHAERRQQEEKQQRQQLMSGANGRALQLASAMKSASTEGARFQQRVREFGDVGGGPCPDYSVAPSTAHREEARLDASARLDRIVSATQAVQRAEQAVVATTSGMGMNQRHDMSDHYSRASGRGMHEGRLLDWNHSNLTLTDAKTGRVVHALKPPELEEPTEGGRTVWQYLREKAIQGAAEQQKKSEEWQRVMKKKNLQARPL